MCQAYEGEKAYLFASERADRKRKIEQHLSGEEPLSDDELKEMAVQELMARDAGY